MTEQNRNRDNPESSRGRRDDDLEKTIGPDDIASDPFDADDFHADNPSEPSTVDDFAECLAMSGLMSSQKLEAFLEGLDSDETPRDASSLAESLVRYGKLTSYQAEVLGRGRTRGLVLGNYEIQKRLGTGGMSAVFQAQHRRMKRTVALKVLPPSLTHSKDAVDRFYREMEVVAKLQHPNIAAAYDADTSDGIHFIVMEMVEGPNLDLYVQEAGHLPVPVGLQLTIQAARGLQHAHAKGVVHRDIKPSNFLVDQQGTLKILDMGLAQLKGGPGDEGQPHLTQPGRVMGTVDYMAPEQAVDATTVDYRADVYSLGCTLFFLLTARTLAPDGAIPQKLIWHASKAPPKLGDVCREAPDDLDRVFQRMVAKDPAHRPQSMADVEQELDQVLAELSDGTELPLQGNDLARYIGLSIASPSSLPMPAPIAPPAPVTVEPQSGFPMDAGVHSKLDAVLVGIHLTAASSMIGKVVRAIGDNGDIIEGAVEGVSVDAEDLERKIKLHVGGNRILLTSVREVMP